jgi:DNA modification methylase
MNGEVADLVITDPPYNVNYGEKVQDLAERLTTCVTRKKSDIKNDNLSDAAFRKFIREAYRAMYGAMREGAAIYVFHADTQGLPFRQEFISANFKLSECLIWEKNTFVLGRQDYHWRHEPILYGWKLGEAHYFVEDRSQDTVLLQEELDLNSKTKEELIAIIEEFRQAYKDKTSVIYENKPLRSAMHPTMKPVGLYGKLMLNSSRSGDIVADFFGGSGTLIMAAEQLHRKARVIEYDEVFCDAIIERWESYTGQRQLC